MNDSNKYQDDQVTKKVYAPLFEKLDAFSANDQAVIIGIDGNAGSGKSQLAKLLLKKYDCQIFHMDDYFLPFEMKIKERLSEPGGNVHYERFLHEVMEPLKKGEVISYQPYDCQVRDYVNPVEVSPKKINIVEGVYSFHPVLQQFYDWKLFLQVHPDVQFERIREREGEQKLQMFIDRWIPLENHYFEALAIKKLADMVIDTSNLSSLQ